MDTQDESLALEMESDAATTPVLPPEYKAEVVELVRSTGKTVGQVAKELELTETAGQEWVKRADLDAGRRHDGFTTAERDELRRLRRENRDLREECEILRKAAVSSPGDRSPVSCNQPAHLPGRRGRGRRLDHRRLAPAHPQAIEAGEHAPDLLTSTRVRVGKRRKDGRWCQRSTGTKEKHQRGMSRGPPRTDQRRAGRSSGLWPPWRPALGDDGPLTRSG